MTKTTTLTAAVLAALTLSIAAVASAADPAPQAAASQQADKPGHDGHRRGPHRGHGMPGPAGGFDGIARLDSDNDGRISRAEAEAGEQAARAHRDARQAQRQARREAAPEGARGQGRHPEARQDGKRGGPQGRGPGDAPGRGFGLVADFDAIDGNRDGYITRAELRSWHQAKRAEREAEAGRRFDTQFREADLNGDGKLSRVEASEKMPHLAERFAWLDENGDGFLSREELRPGHARR